MININSRCRAYLNERGRAALLEQSSPQRSSLEAVLLQGRPLHVKELLPQENGRDYNIVLLHKGEEYCLPYEHVSAVFLP